LKITTRLPSLYSAILLICFAFILITTVVYFFLPVHVTSPDPQNFGIGIDWKLAFRPAVHTMLSGQNPYIHGLFNPPWALLPLIPFAFLSPALGSAALFALGIMAFAYAAFRFGAKPWLMGLFLFTPFVITNSVNGNIDWMVALGCTLPPQFGLFLVLVKPQLGLGIAIFWLIEAWRTGRMREVVRVFAPVSMHSSSHSLYGLWPLKYMTQTADAASSNSALFPAGIIIGVTLLISSLRSRKPDLAVTSSPFFSPYVTVHGWSIALFGLLTRPAECTAAIVMVWILQIVNILI
jgi:hypothetical protein